MMDETALILMAKAILRDMLGVKKPKPDLFVVGSRPAKASPAEQQERAAERPIDRRRHTAGLK